MKPVSKRPGDKDSEYLIEGDKVIAALTKLAAPAACNK